MTNDNSFVDNEENKSPTLRDGSLKLRLDNSILTNHSRFQTKRDLEIYSQQILGEDKLTTFIVPDI